MKKRFSLFRKKIERVFYGFIAVVPVILLLLPADFFDKGQSLCLSVLLSGMQCYACGMTRGVMHFVHFEFEKAWEYNQLTFVVVPMLFPYWLNAIYEVFDKEKPLLLRKIF